jgi:hypothetical protein
VTDPDECGRKDHKHRIKQNSKTRDGSTASGCGFLSIVFFATEFCRREELLQLLCGFFCAVVSLESCFFCRDTAPEKV